MAKATVSARPSTNVSRGPYSLAEVVRLAEVTRNALDGWVAHGLVECSANESSGKGDERRYNLMDVQIARLIRQVRDLRLTLDQLHPLLHAFKETDLTSKKCLLVVGSNGDAVHHENPELASLLDARGMEAAIVVAPAGIHRMATTLDGELDFDGRPRRRGRPKKDPKASSKAKKTTKDPSTRDRRGKK